MTAGASAHLFVLYPSTKPKRRKSAGDFSSRRHPSKTAAVRRRMTDAALSAARHCAWECLKSRSTSLISLTKHVVKKNNLKALKIYLVCVTRRKTNKKKSENILITVTYNTFVSECDLMVYTICDLEQEINKYKQESYTWQQCVEGMLWNRGKVQVVYKIFWHYPSLLLKTIQLLS